MAQFSTAALAMPRPLGRLAATLLAVAVAAATMTLAAPVRAAGGNGLRDAANAHRLEGGLHAVVGTGLLDDIATHRAQQMVKANKLEHDIDYVSDRLNRAGVCWQGFGEIIAWERGYPDYSYARTVGQWWDSKEHHKVMMTPEYNAAGGAWDTASDGGHYSVMIFVDLCNPFATAAVRLLQPAARYNPDRQLVVRPGAVTALRFNSDGEAIGKMTHWFDSIHVYTAAGRVKLDGRAWLKVSSGPLAYYWVRESSRTYVRGRTELDEFNPEPRLITEAGRYVGLRFNWLGRETAVKRLTFAHWRSPSAAARAVINGRRYFLMGSGPLEGFWVRDTAKIYFR
jgi:uncharacterized protein YkwD